MEDNPYSKIMTMMQPQNGELIMRRGTIRNVSPLVIDVAGITVSRSELMVNANMLSHREYIQPIGSTVPSFEANVKPQLLSGDTIIMLTEDDQVFYVLCKVVSV